VRPIFREKTKQATITDRCALKRANEVAVGSSPIDVAPRMIIRPLRLRAGKFVFSDAKRLLQHYLPNADIGRECPRRQFIGCLRKLPPSAYNFLARSIESTQTRLVDPDETPDRRPHLRCSIWRKLRGGDFVAKASTHLVLLMPFKQHRSSQRISNDSN
jgi:hypothetical protein